MYSNQNKLQLIRSEREENNCPQFVQSSTYFVNALYQASFSSDELKKIHCFKSWPFTGAEMRSAETKTN